MDFKDHFSKAAVGYARFRPRYPPALFAFLADAAPSRDAAWDCATGSGQAAVGLAPHFARVLATDASADQIASATPCPNVEYRVARAEESGLPRASVDLVTVAQALHWFDLPAFWAEAARVLRPRGLLALWSYDRLAVAPTIDPVIERYYVHTVGPFWPPERRIVEEGYRSIHLPFPERPCLPFEMTASWRLPDLLGYLRTWSATQRYAAAHGHDPVVPLADQLAVVWGDPDRPRDIAWPLAIRLAVKR